MRPDRRRDLIQILHRGQASSQEDIVQALRGRGHDVTQATVSRDLRELGATKVRVAEGYSYRLPEDIPPVGNGDLVGRRLDRTLGEFALDVMQAATLVVVKTPPGHASAVARAIDQSPLDAVMGTVAGDDTVFVATPSEATARWLADEWRGEHEALSEMAR
ncbi:MAG: arginine repressor [Actinomycetota bacterium]|nr:arginine repressor [Actinomycetota bacterium]